MPSTRKMDKCQIGEPNTATDGEPAPDGYTYGGEIRCALLIGRAREVQNGTEIIKTNARIAVPRGTLLTNRHRVRVTRYRNQALNEDDFRTFAVVGEIMEEPQETVADMVSVTGNAIG